MPRSPHPGVTRWRHTTTEMHGFVTGGSAGLWQQGANRGREWLVLLYHWGPVPQSGVWWLLRSLQAGCLTVHALHGLRSNTSYVAVPFPLPPGPALSPMRKRISLLLRLSIVLQKFRHTYIHDIHFKKQTTDTSKLWSSILFSIGYYFALPLVAPFNEAQ